MEHMNSTGVNPYWDDRGLRNEGEEDEEGEDEEEDEERIGSLLQGDIVGLEEEDSEEEEEEYCISPWIFNAEF